MEDKFRIRICSDLDYEEMVADITYENHTIATVTQENGADKMEIEIYSPKHLEKWIFSLDSFIECLSFAKSTLENMQKLPEE